MHILLMTLLACGEKDTDTALETEDATEATEATEETEDTAANSEDTQTDEPAGWSACDIGSDATSAMLPSSASEAGQLTIMPDLGDSYLLTKEASAEGWFVMEVSEWMCDIELYTQEGVTLTLETPASSDWELGDVSAPVAECENDGIYRASWTFHAWGSYVVHVEGADQTDIWLGSIMVFN